MVQIAVDRPRPIRHEYKGIELKIAFNWDNITNLPRAAVITIANQEPGDFFICDIIQRDWTSYEQAIVEGKEAAERWIDLQPNA